MKARGIMLFIHLCEFGIHALSTPTRLPTGIQNLTSVSDTPSGSKRVKKTDCKAKKTPSASGEMRGLPMSSVASGTTTVTVTVSPSSGTDESVAPFTATPAWSQVDPSHILFSGTSPVGVIDNTTAAGSTMSSSAADNASFTMPSSAIYPIETYEVPYGVIDGNTSYLNATIATGHGLSFLLSAYSSEGTTCTRNLGVILPASATSTPTTSSQNSTSLAIGNTTKATSTDREQSSTTTVFTNATRTLVIQLTTTSTATPTKSDTQTPMGSSEPAQLGARHAKNLFQPKPFADLRSSLKRVNPKKAHQPSDFEEKKNNPTRSPVKNAGRSRLAPAVPAVAAIVLAVMLVSGVSFNTTSSSTVASKSTSDGATVFIGGLAPIHILNSIITPSPTAHSHILKPGKGGKAQYTEANPPQSPKGDTATETNADDSRSSTSSGTRRLTFGVAAASIPGELSTAISTTVDAAPASETFGSQALHEEDVNSPKRREPKWFKPMSNACAAGACTSAAGRTISRPYVSSPFALVVGLLVMTLLLPVVNASGTQSTNTSTLSSTNASFQPAVPPSTDHSHVRKDPEPHEAQPNKPAASSTLSTSTTSPSHTTSFPQPDLEQRNACGAEFPHPCSSDAAS